MRRFLALASVCLWLAPAAASAQDYVLFESGPVRPLAMLPGGEQMVAVNTPDARLEVFRLNEAGWPSRTDSIPVGLEPVAVAARTATEVWVVNHLSDSVSIVDLEQGRVVRTLLVGDEPRDIVFAGGRAFITTAHRGQHRTHSSIASVPGAGDPELTEPSVPRADVWVFDAADPGAGPGGTPLKIVELFGDTPRALTVSPDGSTVYAAVFHSGNQTTAVSEGMVCDGFASAGPCSGDGVTVPGGLPGGQLPGGNPGPDDNFQGVTAPEVGLIVEWDEADGEWQDELGRNWTNAVRFDLPDWDVFAIDSSTLVQTASYPHVGTILFNMAVHPTTGKVYVSNTDAQNMVRFEGHGDHAGSTVQGDLARSQITVIDPGAGTVSPRHLNKHIDYSQLPAPVGTKQHSLSTPLEMALSGDGSTLYVAAFGSSRVGVFDVASLENDSFDPTSASAGYISVSGGGPSGLVLDDARERLYVATRFDNSISVVDTATGTELGSVPMPNPEPESVVEGRPLLYDADLTSSNGEASCASCHVFGDLDSIAWDLGDPDAPVTDNPIPQTTFGFGGGQNGGAANDEFHPMKGPMTTQTLRGLSNSGAMHWRGDRADGFFGLDDPYGDGDEELSFNNFIVAFEGLVGRDALVSAGQMQEFTDFALQMTLPPNPVRHLDNGLTPAQSSAETFYFNNVSDVIFTCNGCHTLDPSEGFFGTGGLASFEGETQIFKIPHLRNIYQKVGMFGMPSVDFIDSTTTSHQGDQIRGYGFLHDGSVDTVLNFFRANVFNGFDGDGERADLEQLMLAFESDLAPVVGQQVTLDADNAASAGPRIGLLIQRAEAGFISEILGGNTTECELIVKGRVGDENRGWLYDPGSDLFDPDRSSEPALSDAALRALAQTPGQELTYTCVPPGTGLRAALDRDLDGVFDADERDQGTQPGNAGSVAGACSDGVDNDGDGLVDLADPGCEDASSDIENPACNDGFDNDGDGAVDGADPNCDGKPWRKLEAACGLLGIELFLVLPAVRRLARRRRA